VGQHSPKPSWFGAVHNRIAHELAGLVQRPGNDGSDMVERSRESAYRLTCAPAVRLASVLAASISNRIARLAVRHTTRRCPAPERVLASCVERYPMVTAPNTTVFGPVLSRRGPGCRRPQTSTARPTGDHPELTATRESADDYDRRKHTGTDRSSIGTSLGPRSRIRTPVRELVVRRVAELAKTPGPTCAALARYLPRSPSP